MSPSTVSPVSARTAPADFSVDGHIPGLLAAFAMLRTVLDNRGRDARGIASLTDCPTIGVIPFDLKAAGRPIILEADPTNQGAEAFLALRTNFQFVELDGVHTFVMAPKVVTARPMEVRHPAGTVRAITPI